MKHVYMFVVVIMVITGLSSCATQSRSSHHANVVNQSNSSQQNNPNVSNNKVAIFDSEKYSHSSIHDSRYQQKTVVKSLIRKAHKELAKGKMEASVSTLERALRIDSRDPELWHLLAGRRLKQKKTLMAERLAKKSNSLIGHDNDLKQKNWKIIMLVRKEIGDQKGLNYARQKLRQLNN